MAGKWTWIPVTEKEAEALIRTIKSERVAFSPRSDRARLLRLASKVSFRVFRTFLR